MGNRKSSYEKVDDDGKDLLYGILYPMDHSPSYSTISIRLSFHC